MSRSRTRLAMLMIGIAGLLLVGRSALADTVTATMGDTNTFLGEQIWFTGPSGTEYGYAGRMSWTRTDLGAPRAPGVYAGVSQTFYSYCIELYQNVNFTGHYIYDAAAVEDAPKPGDISGQIKDKADDIRRLWSVGYAGGEPTTNDQGAAFQLAVWKIVYDSNYDLTTGSLKISTDEGKQTAASVYSLAQSYLNQIDPAKNANKNSILKSSVIALSHPQYQDQITVSSSSAPPQQPTSPVPLPASVWTGLALLAGVGIIKLRGRKQMAM